MNDFLGNSVTAASVQALRVYERAVDAHLHAWPGVNPALDEALADDPDFVLAHALQALWMQMFSRFDEARAALGRAEAGAPKTSAREQSHVALVSAIVGGRAHAALARVQQHAQHFPTDVLSASTAMGAYGLFAFSGRLDHDAARCAFIEALAPQLPAELPWLLMHRAWVRIEGGAADEGLELARRSMAARPHNGHGAHVLLHGLYETQRPREALDFLVAWLPAYADDALMWGHLQWHGALAELALGDLDNATRRMLGPVMEFLPKGPPFMVCPTRHRCCGGWTAGREQAAGQRRYAMPNDTSRRAAMSLAKCTWRCWPLHGATPLPCRPDWPGSTSRRAAAMKAPVAAAFVRRCRRCAA